MVEMSQRVSGGRRWSACGAAWARFRWFAGLAVAVRLRLASFKSAMESTADGYAGPEQLHGDVRTPPDDLCFYYCFVFFQDLNSLLAIGAVVWVGLGSGVV